MLGTSRQSRNTSHIDEILEAEGQISDSEKKKKQRKWTAKGKGKVVDPDLEGDPEYVASSSESSSTVEGGETDDVEISNREVSPNLLLISQFHDCS